jgi:hypothetical protein
VIKNIPGSPHSRVFIAPFQIDWGIKHNGTFETMKRCVSGDSIEDKGDTPKRRKPNAELEKDSSSDNGSSDSSDDQSWEPLSDDEESVLGDGAEVSSGYGTRSKGKVPCLVDSDGVNSIMDRVDGDVYKAASDSSSSVSSEDESGEDDSVESDESSDDEPDTDDDDYSDDDSFVTSEEDEPASLVRCDAGIVEIADTSAHDSTQA